MRGLGFRYVVGVICVALLGSGALSGCGASNYPAPEMDLGWLHSPENPKGECPSKQVINVEVNDPDRQYEGPLNLELRRYINDEETQDPVEHSSTFVKTSRTTGYFDLTVGETLPRQSVRSGSNGLHAVVSEVWDRNTDDWEPLERRILLGSIYVSDCDEEQPVSDLKAEFHFGETSGCPFMQLVDVAGAADNADLSLKLSIDGNPVDNTAEFITETMNVKEGFDGYFVLEAGDEFDATLGGEHTLKVEVSDGVGSVTIEGKFTADSC